MKTNKRTLFKTVRKMDRTICANFSSCSCNVECNVRGNHSAQYDSVQLGR